ncbi:hypothetical protein KsCSTR_30790 [Candidatus Kuenenia stuttgartiensis]|uniref:Uncharacterized protein n=1 Tax=Kuenenia stuttgartiensis TaxID=174633 RepID=Q1Q5D5_KUEST|nr:hypothetical protein KsCSTR_30790 [Candidatus Kuenenia stuttgartiensis]CAJ75229.1 unknown protein [Candidatus Kuenenia stuttgartiensis]
MLSKLFFPFEFFFILFHYFVKNQLSSRQSLWLVAWTFTYWIKQNAYLTKILETKPTTFNEIKQAAIPYSDLPLPTPYQRTKNSPMTILNLNPNT